MSHASGLICYCFCWASWQGWDVCVKALLWCAVYHSSLCAPPGEGRHFCWKLVFLGRILLFHVLFWQRSLNFPKSLCFLSLIWQPKYSHLATLREMDMEKGWIGIFAYSNQCFPSLQCQKMVFFSKGTSKSFGNVKKPDSKSPSSWSSARGLHTEIWQASFIIWFSACWLHVIWHGLVRQHGRQFSEEGGRVCQWEWVLCLSRRRCQPGAFSLPVLLSQYSCS